LKRITGLKKIPPAEIAGKLKREARAAQREVLNKTLTLIISAFGLIAALAWNDAIKALLASVFRQEAGIMSLFIYAILITILAVLVTIYSSRVSAKAGG
jgi:ABC-type multidrug transport system fused ATPase/permease subunit